MSSFNWSPLGGGSGSGGSGVTIYPTFADFAPGTQAGELAVAADTGKLYEWNDIIWQVIAGTGVALTVGAFGSVPNANGLSLTSNSLIMQPASASFPGGVSVGTQSFQGAKSFVTGLLFPDGTNSAPGLALINSPSSGLYLSGANKIALAVQGVQVFDTIKSTGSFGNMGVGTTASVSDSYPLVIQRSVAGMLATQTSNVDSGAGSSSKDQLAVDAGNNLVETAVFSAATVAPDAYAGGRATVRPSGGTAGLSLIGGDLLTGDVRVYVGGDYASTGKSVSFNSDKTTTFYGNISAPNLTTGTVTSVAMTVPTFLSISGSPITTSGTLALTLSGTALPIANGGTGVTTVPASASASAFAAWDANVNIAASNFLAGYATTATSGGVNTLTVASAARQFYTGASADTVKLPVTSTLALGHTFTIVNKSTNTLTVQSSGANTIQAMGQATFLVVTCILTTGTTAASWSIAAYGAIGTVGVNLGGTGLTSGTQGGIPYFSSTGAMLSTALLTQNQLILGGGTGGGPISLAAGSQYQVLRMGASTPAYGALNLDQSAAVTGVLPIANGGTGSATVAAATFFAGPTSGSNAAPSFRALQAPTIQKLTSGSPATYTLPAGCLYIRLKVVGGGGGGGSSGGGTPQVGGNGGSTLWKDGTGVTTYITASGGTGGGTANGGAGGSCSVSGGPIGQPITGGTGSAGCNIAIANGQAVGGTGAASPFGGAGGGSYTANGASAVANTGSGGGGGSDSSVAAAGGGGGAGGYIEAIIASPAATYQYTIGAAGAATTTGNRQGGLGGTGYIEVTEYYQ